MAYALSTTVPQPFAETLEATRRRPGRRRASASSPRSTSPPPSRRSSTPTSPPRSSSGPAGRRWPTPRSQAEPSIGLLLPCNVVVRAVDDDTTLVEAMDPEVMVTLTGNENLADVAADARDRLTAALAALTA